MSEKIACHRNFALARLCVLHTVAVACARGVGHDDLHAAVRRVICPLPLFAVVVADVVGVRLLKLQQGYWRSGARDESFVRRAVLSFAPKNAIILVRATTAVPARQT